MNIYHVNHLEEKLQETLERVFLLLCRSIRMDAFYLSRMDDDMHTILTSIWHRDHVYFHQGDSFPLDESFCALTRNHGGTALVLPDTSLHEEFYRLQKQHKLEIGSFIGIPVVLLDGTFFGSLCAFSKTVQSFTEEQITMMQTMADFISNVVEMERLAISDKLTGLYDRHVLKSVDLNGQDYSVLFIDVDNFKRVNDMFGNDSGDFLLKEIANRLELVARPSDCIIRFAGDEFIFILPHVDISEAVNLGEKLIESFREAIHWNNYSFHITLSIGVSASENNLTIEQMIKRADIAMRMVKEKGKNGVKVFQEVDFEQQGKNLDTLFQETMKDSLFHHNKDATFVIDCDGIIKIVNQACEDVTGYMVEELLEERFLSIFYVEELRQLKSVFQQVLEGNTQLIDTTIVNKKGLKVSIRSQLIPLIIEEKVEGVCGIVKNTTKEKNLEGLLLGQESILEKLATTSDLQETLEAVALLAESQLPDSYCSILIVDKSEEFLSLIAAPSLPKDYADAVKYIKISPSIGSCGVAAFERKLVITEDIAIDPNWRQFQEIALQSGFKSCYSSPIIGKHDQLLGTLAIYYKQNRRPNLMELQLLERAANLARLAIEQKRTEELLTEAEYLDPLTKLPNRLAISKEFHHVMDSCQERPKPFTFAIVHINQLKEINESFGYEFGDLLISKVAKRLMFSVENYTGLYRIEGNEFAFVFSTIRRKQIMQTIHAITNAFTVPFQVSSEELYVSIHIGISQYPKDDEHFSIILQKAYHALSVAKKSGQPFQFYHREMHMKKQQILLARDLRKALLQQDFMLHYQPIYCVKDEELIGIEALIRWNHPEKGIISPNCFIPLAEETGLIKEIGKWVLQTACTQAKEWQNKYFKPLQMSVNLSVKQFMDNELVAMVASVLTECQLEAKYLNLEITESMTADVEHTLKQLHALKRLGVSVSIDDFGTGYSSFSYLHQFPIDSVKIDKSFIQNATLFAIPQAIISMVHHLNLSVVAEGVETLEQYEFLRGQHCDNVQGYFFSKPLPAEEIEVLLNMSDAQMKLRG